MWTTVLRLNAREHSSFALKIAVRIVNWTDSTWTLRKLIALIHLVQLLTCEASVLHRLHNAQIASHAGPKILIELLTSCLRKIWHCSAPVTDPYNSPIYMAAYRKFQNSKLSAYLHGYSRDDSALISSFKSSDVVDPVDDETSSIVERLIFEMLLTKLKAFREAWIALVGERISNVNTDVAQIISSLTVVSTVFCASVQTSHSALRREITTHTIEMWHTLINFASQLDGQTRRGFLLVMTKALLSFQFKDHHQRASINKSLSDLVAPLLQLLQETLDDYREGDLPESDPMDINESFSSQTTHAIRDISCTGILREDLPFAVDEGAILIRNTVLLFIRQASIRSQNGESPKTADIIQFAKSLVPRNFLLARRPLMAFLSEIQLISRSDATQLLQTVAEACIQDANFERCEASLCLCLEAMTSLAKLWGTEDTDNLGAVASDIYGWFIEVILGKRLASPRVLIYLAKMLDAVLKVNPNFTCNNSLPSPRTSLFEILQCGNNSVKFVVAKQLCSIFDRFVLTEHEAILDDVVNSLPADLDDNEGIAVRLFILTELASRWTTLLRRCVYHLFETAAQVPSAAKYAERCLQCLCRALHLSSSRDIFVLFSPQILYTWLENNNIDAIPFSIYGYESLSGLVAAVQDEFVGQIAMRANAAQAEGLTKLFGLSWRDLVARFFGKAEAYAIARDISMPPREDTTKSTESFLRKQLGSETYITLVRSRFPDIVATLFVSLGEEQGIERAFTKRHDFVSAKKSLSDMLNLSSSDITLPVGQQPSFRARYLLDEVGFLCQRIDLDIHSIWSAPLVVYICRSLFDTIVPSLGLLHACAVLRKLRVAICLSGPTVLSGYPLEMLLHNLRRYLTDFHCSEDSIGIFWYLLDKGKMYLQSRPRFILGLIVATFISLSKFLNSTQESTTQESHFRNTMSRAQSLKNWVAKYMQTYLPIGLDQEERDVFGRFIHSAQNVGDAGSPVKGSHEGDLLYELLDDRTSGRHLLSQASFDMILQLGYSSFTPSQRTRDDILGDDEKAILQANTLWEILAKVRLGTHFRMWAAQTLGRVHAATGMTSEKLNREHSNEELRDRSGLKRHDEYSDTLILCQVQLLLWSEDHVTAGSAEKTAQMMITRLHNNDTVGLYDDILEPILIRDLNWGSQPYTSVTTESTAHSISNLHHWSSGASLEQWSSDLIMASSVELRSDPVVYSLQDMVSKHPQLAPEIVPAVVHKLLLTALASQDNVRKNLSGAFGNVLLSRSDHDTQAIELVIRMILYLRCQPLPKEGTMAGRNSWLDIDFAVAAAAADFRKAHKTALLFLEIQAAQSHLQPSRASRRSSVATLEHHFPLMQTIYHNIDDPDFFYGVQEQVSVDSIIRKMDREGGGFQKLSFQSALYDSSLKCASNGEPGKHVSGLLSVLSAANHDGIARAVQLHHAPKKEGEIPETALSIALNLHQWDVPTAAVADAEMAAFINVFRELSAGRLTVIDSLLGNGLLACVDKITSRTDTVSSAQQSLGMLAALAEVKDLLSSRNLEDVNDQWQTMAQRNRWMYFER